MEIMSILQLGFFSKTRKMIIANPIFCFLAFVSVRSQQAAEEFILPNTLIPQTYTIEVYTNIEDTDFSFWGYVQIDIKCAEPTNEIVLHSKDLELQKANITFTHFLDDESRTTSLIPVTNIHTDVHDLLKIEVDRTLTTKGIYKLHIPFKGVLNKNSLIGYYRNYYVDEATEENKWFAATMFSPKQARQAFPCFDVPRFLAKFNVSLGHSKLLTAASNMPIKESRDISEPDNWILDVFEETPVMPTYLVTFFVSDFVRVNTPNTNLSYPLAALTWKGTENKVQFAMDTAARVLNYYKELFGVDYQLPKLDITPMPHFLFSGMENYGLVTITEGDMLFSLDTMTVYNRYDVGTSICHEMFHMWLGNLVIIEWWIDIWLNEGFAAFFEEYSISKIYPELKSLNWGFVRKYGNVMTIDSTLTSVPIANIIKQDTDFDTLFGTLTYSKGSYLVRMMHMLFGEDVFNSVLAKYVQNFRLKTVNLDDMWNLYYAEVKQSAYVLQPKLHIKTIMEPWMMQNGFPMLNISRDYKSNKITVIQERYLPQISNEKISENDRKRCWTVPLTYTTSTELNFVNTNAKKWLMCEDEQLIFDLDLPQNDWIIFNIQMEVLCRINYDVQNWKTIQKTLVSDCDKIHQLNRVQILSDCLEFAFHGLIDYSLALDIVLYLRNEKELLPFQKAMNLINVFRTILKRTNIYDLFLNYLRDITEIQFVRTGNMTEIPTDFIGNQYKKLLVTWGCISRLESCTNQSDDLFQSWMTDPNPDVNIPFSSDIRYYVYCETIRTGNNEIWEFLWQRYKNFQEDSQRRDMLDALTCSHDVNKLQTILEWSIDPSRTSESDSSEIFSEMTRNPLGYSFAKEFFMQRFDDIYKFHNRNSTTLEVYVKAIVNSVVRQEELDEFKAFADTVKTPLKDIESTLTDAYNQANLNIRWFDLNFLNISNYFLDNYSGRK